MDEIEKLVGKGYLVVAYEQSPGQNVMHVIGRGARFELIKGVVESLGEPDESFSSPDSESCLKKLRKAMREADGL